MRVVVLWIVELTEDLVLDPYIFYILVGLGTIHTVLVLGVVL